MTELISYCVFLEKVVWVPSLYQTALGSLQNLLQLHAGLLKPLHHAAVGLHVLSPLAGFLDHCLVNTGYIKNLQHLHSPSIPTLILRGDRRGEERKGEHPCAVPARRPGGPLLVSAAKTCPCDPGSYCSPGFSGWSGGSSQLQLSTSCSFV